MDEMRDRLIEIINRAKCQYVARCTTAYGHSIKGELEGVADALIEAGVMLPKYSKGQIVPTAKKGIMAKIREPRVSYLIEFQNCELAIVEEYITKAAESYAIAALKEVSCQNDNKPKGEK